MTSLNVSAIWRARQERQIYTIGPTSLRDASPRDFPSTVYIGERRMDAEGSVADDRSCPTCRKNANSIRYLIPATGNSPANKIPIQRRLATNIPV